METAVLQKFGIDPSAIQIEPIRDGLINHTWKISDEEQKYILQKINSTVFKNPEDIDANISLIARHLKKHRPEYLFPAPAMAQNGDTLVWHNAEAFRLFPYIDNSHTINTVQNADQAFEAARQFGKFTASLKSLDTSLLKTTLPNFHDLSHRYSRFTYACENGHPQRISEAAVLISCLKKRTDIVQRFEGIKKDPDFQQRVTHHDSKISNVLFNEHNKGLCVIDLDTVMPGYFISDVGDMLRTYLSAGNEEETDLAKIAVRKDVCVAIREGYLSEMNDALSEKEKDHFLFAGLFLTYMQSIRFLTDFLLNVPYYGAAYEGHNLARAKNQWVLLERMEEAFQ